MSEWMYFADNELIFIVKEAANRNVVNQKLIYPHPLPMKFYD